MLHEGRNREVRRIWETQNVTVSRLIRIRYGNISLERSLRAGQFRELSTRGLRSLYQIVDMTLEEDYFLPQDEFKNKKNKTFKKTHKNSKQNPTQKKTNPDNS